MTFLMILDYTKNNCIRYRYGDITEELKTYKLIENYITLINWLLKSDYVICENCEKFNKIISKINDETDKFKNSIQLFKIIYINTYFSNIVNSFSILYNVDLNDARNCDNLIIYEYLFHYINDSSVYEDDIIIKLTKQKQELTNIVKKVMLNGPYGANEYNKISKLETQIDTYIQKNDFITSELNKLKSHLENIKLELKNTRENNVNMLNEISSMKHTIIEKTKIINDLNQTLENNYIKNINMELDLKALTNEFNINTKKLTQLRDSNNLLTLENSRLMECINENHNQNVIADTKIQNDQSNQLIIEQEINRKYEKMFNLIKKYIHDNELLTIHFNVNNRKYVLKCEKQYEYLLENLKNNMPDISGVVDSLSVQAIIENLNNYPNCISVILEQISYTCKVINNIIELQIKQKNFNKYIMNKIFMRLQNITDAEINDNLTKNKCCVCLDNDVNICIFPCDHCILCNYCVKTINTCPLCRKYIDNFMTVYL